MRLGSWISGNPWIAQQVGFETPVVHRSRAAVHRRGGAARRSPIRILLWRRELWFVGRPLCRTLKFLSFGLTRTHLASMAIDAQAHQVGVDAGGACIQR